LKIKLKKNTAICIAMSGAKVGGWRGWMVCLWAGLTIKPQLPTLANFYLLVASILSAPLGNPSRTTQFSGGENVAFSWEFFK